VNDNGQPQDDQELPRWLLAKSKAARAEGEMRLRIQKKLCQAAYDEMMLSGSWRLALAGDKQRRRLAAAFVDVQVENKSQATKEQFRDKCREYGVPLIVIVLVLSIAWDILWYFWTHRKPEVAE
jgi:hypothetical protein